MTPAARYAAAAEVVEAVLAGDRLEPALRAWGRAHRFAGSKDRRAIADITYDIARRWWSAAALGGGDSGRARVLGLLRATGVEPDTVFTGEGHAMARLCEGERALQDGQVPLDFPPFLIEQLCEDYGDDLGALNAAMQLRAPVDIRVNLLKTSREVLAEALLKEGFAAEPVADVPTALRLAGEARGLTQSDLFLKGHFELQDAGSQQIVNFTAPQPGERVLDFCAGGGGKALALAALTRGQVVAHDVEPRRMADIPARAARAGADIVRCTPEQLDGQTFDLVFVDAPCSGSGSWRRDPSGKITLTPERFDHLLEMQTDALVQAFRYLSPTGRLAYATCSLLRAENIKKIRLYLNESDSLVSIGDRISSPLANGDGFYCNLITTRSNL